MVPGIMRVLSIIHVCISFEINRINDWISNSCTTLWYKAISWPGESSVASDFIKTIGYFGEENVIIRYSEAFIGGFRCNNHIVLSGNSFNKEFAGGCVLKGKN